METKLFRTNLKCQSCVSKVARVLDGDHHISNWSVQTDDERKLLSVSGKNVDSGHVRSLLATAGFAVLGEVTPAELPAPEGRSTPATYFPLMLIFLYLTGFVAIAQTRAGRLDWVAAVNDFMGAFFVAFSFFKILNLRGFANAYRSYDLVAARSSAYAYSYPFIELTVGICYLTALAPLATNLTTCAVMSISTAGVIRTLLKRQKIQCACLGTVFNLPMSKITLVEDLLMAGMSAVMIAVMLVS